MKKLLSLIFALVLVLTFAGSSVVPAEEYSENMIVHITALCYDTNHVGNKWTSAYFINETEILDGDILTLSAGKYDFSAEIVDNDSTPDIGTNVISYNVTANRLTKGFTVQFVVNVEENTGLYKGYWNEWYIYYDFMPVGDAVVLH